MKTREMEVLSKILGDNYVDTTILSQELEISVRSVRYLIASLKTYLNDYGCELKYSNKRSYYFNKSHHINGVTQ